MKRVAYGRRQTAAAHRVLDQNILLEISPERVDGWAAEAWFSSQGDYAKPIAVSKVRFFLRAVKTTKAMAEYDAIEWARRYIASSAEVLKRR